MIKKLKRFAISYAEEPMVGESDGIPGVLRLLWDGYQAILMIFGLFAVIGAFAEWEGVSAKMVATDLTTLVLLIMLMYDTGKVTSRKTSYYVWKIIVGTGNLAWTALVLFNGKFFLNEYGEASCPIFWLIAAYASGALMQTACMIILIITDRQPPDEDDYDWR